MNKICRSRHIVVTFFSCCGHATYHLCRISSAFSVPKIIQVTWFLTELLIKGGRFYWDTVYIQLAMPNSAKTVLIFSQKETDTQWANSRGGAFGEEAASHACIWIWKHCKHPQPRVRNDMSWGILTVTLRFSCLAYRMLCVCVCTLFLALSIIYCSA